MTSLEILEHVPLRLLNTFKTGGKARYFVDAFTVEDLKEALSFAQNKNLSIFILGEGSNILISDRGFDGLVIRMRMTGIKFENRTKDIVHAVVFAGENWDSFVEKAVSRRLYGVENLSGIPGSVGAAPVQNIGAYGVEAKDSILFVNVFDIESKKIKKISSKDCHFSYRDSIFKSKNGKKYVILSVVFLLKKQGDLSLVYKDIASYFKQRGITNPSLQDVRSAVIEIRKQKLPPLSDYGTAGSFFKNIIVSESKFRLLKKKFKELPSFPAGKGKLKIPTAWIIDNICNLKGLRRGNVGVYEKQALVLVTFGKTTSLEIKKISDFIIKKVKKEINIFIEREVQLIGDF